MANHLHTGRFIEKPSRWVQISVMTGLQGITYAAVPWLKSFWGELILIACSGIAYAYVIAGCNTF